MASIRYLKGDATCPQAKGVKLICHVCNDLGGWGKGFVLALSRRWDRPEAEYRAWHAQGKAAGFGGRARPSSSRSSLPSGSPTCSANVA